MPDKEQSTQPPGLQRQMEIYMAGAQGQKPSQPISIEALEQKAKEVLSPEAYDYVAGGAGSEDTMRANLEAFKRWRIVPNYLRNLSQRDLGVDGIIVSNHGGRQVDGAIAALDALPQVVDAVGDKVSILFDSGIRRGADVIKAIALGARCVLLGRPYCYGLAVNGEQGVREVLNNLLADLDLTLGLTGCKSFAELSRNNVKSPFAAA
jgi:isopentenyl diphosphate isomerase/L-lactate dehydrogenase-like FMN-dependent dehydrogenase